MTAWTVVLQVAGLHGAASAAVVEHTPRRRPGDLAVGDNGIALPAPAGRR
ncbi:MAG: hypothetical protein ACYCTH_07825 [Cellulomonas sp.]|jgi:hypothetical protein